MIKKFAATVLILFVSLSLFAKTKIVPLEDINKPGMYLWVDQERLYTTENESVLIFSLKDYKLIKKFGKKGEGPEEFMLHPSIPMWLDVSGENIMVESFGKLSWWTKDGKFIKEYKLPNPFIIQIQQFGKNFFGIGFTVAGATRKRALSIYDEKMNLIKEVITLDDAFQPGKGMKVLDNAPIQAVYRDKLFTAWDRDFRIIVRDKEGKELYQITTNYVNRKFTGQDRNDFTEFLKTSPMSKDFFEMLKPLKFPEIWPAIFGLNIENDKVYVFTSTKLKEKDKSEMYVFDLKGKLLKKAQLPFIMQTPILPFPANVLNDTVYQLVENEDEERWDLHITEIK